jgi:hypothetical protein
MPELRRFFPVLKIRDGCRQRAGRAGGQAENSDPKKNTQFSVSQTFDLGSSILPASLKTNKNFLSLQKTRPGGCRKTERREDVPARGVDKNPGEECRKETCKILRVFTFG